VAVGEATVVEDLEEDIPNVGVGFFDLGEVREGGEGREEGGRRGEERGGRGGRGGRRERGKRGGEATTLPWLSVCR
jgi:hypothetical protein